MRRCDHKDDDRDRRGEAVVVPEAGRDRELVRVADQDVCGARDARSREGRTALREQVDVVEVVEVEGERRDEQRADGDEQQRQRHAAKDLNGPPPSTRAASVSSSGIDCSAPIETTKKNGVVEPGADEDARHPRPIRVEQPRDVEVEDTIHHAELVVQQSGPHEQRQEARDRPRDDEDRAVDLLEAHAALVQRDREEESDREREEHRRAGEDECPDEHADERRAHGRVVRDAREVLRSRRRSSSRGGAARPCTRTRRCRRP